MKHLPKILLCTAAAALAIGCCNCRKYQRRNRRPFTETEWQLVQLRGRSVTPEEGRFFLVFGKGGGISGAGACNRITGEFSEEQGVLRIGPLATTRMSCPDLAREREFTAAVEATNRYEMDGPMLLFFSGDELQAVFQARPEK